jgi:hypothetical protein
MKHSRILLVCILALAVTVFPQTAGKAKTAVAVVAIDTPMEGPAWAKLERQVLDTSTPALVEFYRKYYDSRGYLQCVLRWGADDGPDDAFENFAGWPEFHALGGSDEVLRLYMKGVDGMIQQYTAAKNHAGTGRPSWNVLQVLKRD